MANLNLKTEWLKKDAAKVTWTDVKRIVDNNLLMGGICLMAVIVIGFGVVELLTNGYLGTMLLCLLAGMFMVIYGQFGTLKLANSILIEGSNLSHNGQTFPLNQISRVEYSSRAKWTGNAPQASSGNSTQIRLWMRDNISHVISDNSWELQINHRIRDEIDAAINTVRKANVASKPKGKAKTQTAPTDEFGMPEY